MQKYIRWIIKNHVDFSDDTIRLSKYKDVYWVEEGKHRVCMAKRAKIDWIWAEVKSIRDEHGSGRMLLPSIGNYEGIHFVEDICQVNQNSQLMFQNEIVLWLGIPRYVDVLKGLTTIELNYLPDTGHYWKPVYHGIKGIFYKKKTTKEKVSLIHFLKYWNRLKSKISLEVNILPNHTNTKVWLMSIPVQNGRRQIDKAKHLYRHVFWRKHSFKQAKSF